MLIGGLELSRRNSAREIPGVDEIMSTSQGYVVSVSDAGSVPSVYAELQKLNESFGGQLTTGNQNAGMGLGYAKTVTLGCKKS